MAEKNSAVELFDLLARVLLRCWVFGLLLLLAWVVAAYFARDFILGLHGPAFGIGKHELELIFYCGLGFLKLQVLLFFFFPWLAIRLVLRGRKR